VLINPFLFLECINHLNQNIKKIIIAVDGYASTGKSTLARQLAHALGYTYIDTGAMYRAVTLYFLENNIGVEDEQQIQDALQLITIQFEKNKVEKRQHTFLNGVNVEEEIRSLRVSNFVSEVSTIAYVRSFLVKQQREMGLNKGIVMDGRDIGTVVFPDAELKLFITAKPQIRAERRFYEMKEMGIATSLEEIKQNLMHRDTIDSNRAVSPLKKANDSIVIDNSALTMEDQLQQALNLAYKILNDMP